ncbi:MAG TPA: patatin-like phospholipase family protein [Acidimicrobiales bacterium]|nr:patatin-like phospholipase family protein [Acidimicrobiales bacterium]
MSVEGSDARKADLVLEGGGVKGIGLLGAIMALDGAGYTFPRIAGTSAGAIVGALVAASVTVGKPLAGLVGVMRELEYPRFRDGTALDRLWVPGRVVQLLAARGIYKGRYVVAWLEEQLRTIGVETFGDLRITAEDDPGSALPPGERYRLVVMTSDISRGQLVRLPWDCARYGIDPDSMRIVDAVRASMSIPFLFEPARLKGATVVDGGMLSDFPVEIFDRPDGQARWPTFGIKLSARPGAVVKAMPTGSISDFALACLRTLLGEHDQYHLDDDHVVERTIFVDTLGVAATDFDIDAPTQEALYANGQAAASRFLAQWPPAHFTAEGRWTG